MSDSAYAPYNTNYGLTLTKPYLTTTEYLNAPTAIDTSNLLPAGSQLSQTPALAEVIGRASSLIDGECLGAWGTLNATVDVENARIWGNNLGQFIVHPKYWPIVEVQAFSYGNTPFTQASVTPSGNIWIEPTQFTVSPGGVVGLGLNSLANIAPRYQYYCQWTYVNGFVNTTLSASVAAGATSVSLADLTAVYPGSPFTLFDAPSDEQITVASTYTPGVNPVPLSGPLAYEHPVGAVVTGLPKAVKQAAISLTTCLIKVRGSGALIADDMGEIRHAAGNAQGAVDDLDLAMYAIRALRQMYVGY